MIPIAELRALTGADAGGADDTLLLQLEAYAVARVQLYSRVYMGVKGAVTDRVIGDGSGYLTLPKGPISEADPITVEESYPWDVAPVPVAVTNFRPRDDQLLRTGSGVWSSGYEYEVTYTAGYAVGEFPPMFYQAVADIVALLFPVAQTNADPVAAAADVYKSEDFGDYSYELADASIPHTTETANDAVGAILAKLPRRIRV